MPTSRPHLAARFEDRFYRALARFLWRRGWVLTVQPYPGYGTTEWVRVLGRVLLVPPGAAARHAAVGHRGHPAVRGWRSFVTVQVPGAQVDVHIGSRAHRVVADRGGYVDVVRPADLEAGNHDVVLGVGGHRVSAPVVVIGPEPAVALVSDIDDTIMVTTLPRPLLAAWNALVLHENARRPVPGMAGFYRRWQTENPGSATFYLSTGAWNVAPAVNRFLDRHAYPTGPLLLTDWGPTNTGWFRSGQEHKLDALRRLMDEFPQLRWVLVGDDGQHDPQIYTQIAEEFGDRVVAIAVRELSPTEQLLAHGTPVPTKDGEVSRRPGDALVVRGADGNALALSFLDAGLL